jgi:hypothetical protein
VDCDGVKMRISLLPIILNSCGRVCISLRLDNTPHQRFPPPLVGAPHHFMRWNIRISLVESGFWFPRLSDNGEAEDNLNISPVHEATYRSNQIPPRIRQYGCLRSSISWVVYMGSIEKEMSCVKNVYVLYVYCYIITACIF